MRTSIRREVERDNMGSIESTYTTIYVKGNAKESAEQVWDHAIALANYIEATTNNTASVTDIEDDKEIMVCTNADTYEDYLEVKEAYNDFKAGARVEVQEEIIEVAKQYVSLNKEEKESFINNQISNILKGEEEHTVFNWSCDILRSADYVQEALVDKSWIYYNQFSRLYNLIMEV